MMKNMFGKIKGGIKFSQKGFALIFVAVLLVVAGIMLSTFKPTAAVKTEIKTDETKKRLKIVQNALGVYADTNSGKYPCPAIRTDTPSAATFGAASSCTGACPTGVTCASADATNYAIIGTVPTRALNLPDEYMLDQWGNRLVYAINKGDVPSGTGSDVLNIKKTDTTDLTSTPEYYLGSAGPNGTGAYSRAGKQVKACSGTNLDIENCNDDINFFQDKWQMADTYAANNLRKFDDISLESYEPEAIACPEQIPGCVFWVDAQDIDNNDNPADEPADGTNLTTWYDKSADGKDLTQADANKKPLYYTSLINSFPGVQLQTSGGAAYFDDMRTSGGSWSTDEYTIFAVQQKKSYGGSESGGVNINGAFHFSTTFGFPPETSTRLLTFHPGSHQYQRSYWKDKPYIHTIRAKKNTYYEVWRDGLQIINNQSFANNISNAGFNFTLVHGADYGEAIYYPTALNAAEINTIECYLSNKWAIQKYGGCDAPISCPVIDPPECPASVSGCQAWFDASNTDYLLGATGTEIAGTDGNNIYHWCDRSGNQNHAMLDYLSSSELFLYDSNGLAASKPAIDIDSWASFAAPASNPVPTARTNIWVMKFDTLGNKTFNVAGVQTNKSTDFSATGRYDLYGTSTFTDDITWYSPEYIIKKNTPIIFVEIIDNVANTRSFYINGMLASTHNLSADINLQFSDIFPADGEIDGKLSEYITYDSALSDANRELIEAELATKWGVDIYNTASCPVVGATTCPAGLTDCTLWLNAHESSGGYALNSSGTAAANGEAVYTWCDKSGNNNHAGKLGPVGSGPIMYTNAINTSYRGIAGGGATVGERYDSSFLVPAHKLGSNDANRSFSGVIVGHYMNGSAGTLPILDAGREHLVLNQNVQKANTTMFNDGVHANTVNVCQNCSFIISYSYDGSGKTRNLTFNGQSPAADAVALARHPAQDYAALHIMGAFGNPYSGRLGEVIHFNKFLTNTERKQVECYVAHQWGLCATLTTGTPTYCSAAGSAYCP